MVFIKQEDGTYNVKSSSGNKFYLVDLEKGTCTCPHFMLRLRWGGGVCKHMQAVKDSLGVECDFGYSVILDFVREKGEVDSLELIEKYDSESVDYLLKSGELIEKNGKIKLLL